MDSRGARKGEGKGGDKGEEIVDRERKMQEEERWEKIGESKYNRWFGRVKGPGVPGYLKKGWGESRWQMVAKFRLGNGMRGGRYWEEGEKRRCRVFGWGEESWEHVWEVCMGWGVEKGWQEMVGEVVGEEGEGDEWLRSIEEKREGCG